MSHYFKDDKLSRPLVYIFFVIFYWLQSWTNSLKSKVLGIKWMYVKTNSKFGSGIEVDWAVSAQSSKVNKNLLINQQWTFGAENFNSKDKNFINFLSNLIRQKIKCKVGQTLCSSFYQNVRNFLENAIFRYFWKIFYFFVLILKNTSQKDQQSIKFCTTLPLVGFDLFDFVTFLR